MDKFDLQPGTPLTGVPFVTAAPLPPNCAALCCGVCVPGNNIIVAGWGANDAGVSPVNLKNYLKQYQRNF